ncbi:MAG: hypothetical protein ACLSAH_20535, partial [Bilophila wadsworthia]
FMLVVVTLKPLGLYHGINIDMVVLVALLVCLIPTTISGLLAAIGIAGMDRLLQRNVLALSGRAVEAAGDVDVLLLDKTGTITLGNRMASAFLPLPGVNIDEMMQAACLALRRRNPGRPFYRRIGEHLGVSLNGCRRMWSACRSRRNPHERRMPPENSSARVRPIPCAVVHSLGLPERRGIEGPRRSRGP